VKTGKIQPQISQMNADVFPAALICANLRNLRFHHLPARETDKALRKNLRKIGV